MINFEILLDISRLICIIVKRKKKVGLMKEIARNKFD